MKSMFKTMMISGLFASLALSVGAVAGDKDLEAAVLPGSDLVTRINVQKLMATPFYQEAKKEDPKAAAVKNPEWAKIEDFFNDLGVKIEDVGNVLVTVDFDIPADRPEIKKEKALFLIGLESAKPWDLKKLGDAIVKASKGEGEKVETEYLTIEAAPVLKIKTTKERPGAVAKAVEEGKPADPAAVAETSEGYVATIGDGKIMLVTQFAADMKAAIQRAKSQQPAVLDAKLAAISVAVPTAQVSGGFVLPQSMKDKLQPKQPAAEKPEGVNMFGGVQEAFRSLQLVGWSISCDKDATFQVKCGLGKKEDATKGGLALNGMLGMVKGMMAMQQGQPQADPNAQMAMQLMQSLTIGSVEQDVIFDMIFPNGLIAQVKAMAKEEAKKAPFLAPPQEE
jgi:hypothetical protein